MTKWFTYFPDKPHWFDEDFDEYFEKKEGVFESWLKTSYEVTLDDPKIYKITAVVYNNKAEFSISYNDNFVYPAGSIECLCATDLFNGFIERVYDPDRFTEK